MNLLAALIDRAGVLSGRGVNHENEAFIGTLRITPIVGGRGVALHYTATGVDGQPLHEEFTLLSLADDQRLCLWPVMSELAFVMPHHVVAPENADDGDGSGSVRAVFATGPRNAGATFREEISIECKAGGAIVYAHSWGLPGGAFAERSQCELFALKH